MFFIAFLVIFISFITFNNSLSLLFDKKQRTHNFYTPYVITPFFNYIIIIFFLHLKFCTHVSYWNLDSLKLKYYTAMKKIKNYLMSETTLMSRKFHLYYFHILWLSYDTREIFQPIDYSLLWASVWVLLVVPCVAMNAICDEFRYLPRWLYSQEYHNIPRKIGDFVFVNGL